MQRSGRQWWVVCGGVGILSIVVVFWTQFERHLFHTIFTSPKNQNKNPISEINLSIVRRELQPRRPSRRRDYDDTGEIDEDMVQVPIPRSALGFPCQDSPKVEEMGTKCRTISRSVGGLGCERKIIDLANERGRNIDAIPLAFRSARVADACPESCGLCELCAPGCAVWFIGNSYCEPQCNNSACHFDGTDCWDADCLVGEWSEWSPCSIICDKGGINGIGGIETRTREILVGKTLNGKACPELIERRTGCNKGILCPIPCQLSAWGSWSECSLDCGPGQSTRTRTIIQPPENGASECGDLIQTRPCFLAECSQPCEVSEWSDWSECSNSCGDGKRTRKRAINVLPVGNYSCPDLFEYSDCKGTVCNQLVSEVCSTLPWDTWTPCSAECGGGTQTRKRTYQLTETDRHLRLEPYGASCQPILFLQEQPCNTFSCGSDCILSDWTDWTECNSLCGVGKSFRRRDILIESAGVGIPCPTHARYEEKECYNGPCPEDCQLTEWSLWSPCDTPTICGQGLTHRQRDIIQYPNHNGKLCDTLFESRPCHKPCDTECSFGSFNQWTNCADECQIEHKHLNTLQSYRWRTIQYGSSECISDQPIVESRACEAFTTVCGEQTDNHCIVTEWGKWSDCSVECGGGIRRRERFIQRLDKPGGLPCPNLIEEESCGRSECPFHCEMGEWGEWSTCSDECGIGTRTRYRQINMAPSLYPAGIPCGPQYETSPCIGEFGDCKTYQSQLSGVPECITSDWSEWSTCSEDCGYYGTRTRTRQIVSDRYVKDKHSCPELTDIQECNRHSCGNDCQLSEWSLWSECTIDCGLPEHGEQIRYRSILKPATPGRLSCPNDQLQETRPCIDLLPCPVPCRLSDWLPWSDCNAPCGIGEQYRIREVTQQPAFGGEHCGPLKDIIDCFKQPCVTDCLVGEWSHWTECSLECNNGNKTRWREVLEIPMNGGIPCPILFEIEDCNDFECPDVNEADCIVSEWSDWSPCPVTCGGGVHQRTRDIIRQEKPGGASCPQLIQIRGCGISRCKNDACVDNIGALTAHAVTCDILRAQGCEKNIKELAESQGMMYPSNIPPEARVKDACPMTCDVCKECAPGCQLRDKGNTICDQECNCSECEFDLGDCGKDCKIPLPVPTSLKLYPPATGLDIGETILITCNKPTDRFQLVPELSRALIMCSESQHTAYHPALELLPVSVFFNPAVYPLRDLNILSCSTDPCLSVSVEGFNYPFELFNGVYDRGDSEDGRSHYIQHEKSLDSRLDIENGHPITRHHLWIDTDTTIVARIQQIMVNHSHILTSNGIHTFQDKPIHQLKGGFVWRMTSFDPTVSRKQLHKTLMVSAISQCRLPPAGQRPLLDKCGGDRSTLWVIMFHPDESSLDHTIVTNISMTCLTKSQRQILLKKKKTMSHMDHMIQSVDELGRPITRVRLSSYVEPYPLFCEDFNETMILTQHTCLELSHILQCHDLLHDFIDTRSSMLLKGIRLRDICPETCHLCQEQCAIGCPDWFLGNDHCDAACNIKECEYDHGDCIDIHRPYTFLNIPGKTISNKTFCEDQPEVHQLTGLTCDQIVESLGCQFLLSQTGRQIPDFLPLDTTIGTVCPDTCELCDSECSPGCPDWFLNNFNCDAACNVKECQYDHGDCSMDYKTIHDHSVPPQKKTTTTTTSMLNPLLCDDLLLTDHFGVSCMTLHHLISSSTTRSCDTTLKDIATLHPDIFESFENLPFLITLKDMCPKLCQCCDPTCERLENPYVNDLLSNIINKKKNHSKKNLPCIDEPIVADMGFTCSLLKAVATNKLNGCNATLLDVAKIEQKIITLPKGIPRFTRVLDACPHTCNCCDCPRYKRPESTTFDYHPPDLDRITSTLKDGEFPNCIHDERIESIANVNCFQLVDAMAGNCSILLSDLTDTLPSDILPNTTLSQACGIACGKCPLCDDQKSVRELSGYTCSQIVDFYDCKHLIVNLWPNIPSDIPSMAQVQHACPKSCGVCPPRLQSNHLHTCEDHPQIHIIGSTCETLQQYSEQNCNKTLLSMGIDSHDLSPDLHPLALIKDACPKTCGLCQSNDEQSIRRCTDNSLVKELNQTCTTLIKIGDLGCENLLYDIAPDKLPNQTPLHLRVKDVCKESCGLCGVPTCMDGFQNGEELGIDCGGPCRACRSCNPAPLKRLGNMYSFEGSGITHLSRRIVKCRQGYVKLSGPDPNILYCKDGSFTKPRLVCGEPRFDVLKGSLRLTDGQHFDYTALPSIHAALINIFQINHTNREELRISRAGDCSELTTIGHFICEDDPSVQKTGFDCSILSRLGCDKSLIILAHEQGVELPSGIPNDALISDACPVTCKTCDFLKKRLSALKIQKDSTNEDLEQETDCLRVDFVLNGITKRESLLNQQLVNIEERVKLSSKFISILSRSLQARGIRVMTRLDHLTITQNANEYLNEHQVEGRFKELQKTHIPISEWKTYYTPSNGDVGAKFVFIAPGLSSPVFDSSAIPVGIRPNSIIGTMYRPTIGVGESLIHSRVLQFGEKTGIVTGWYDSSGSASSISSILLKVAGQCDEPILSKESNINCCQAKYDFEEYLNGPCGLIIYGRSVSDESLTSFCFQRTQSVTDSSYPLYSCYEVAMTIVDNYSTKKKKEGGVACEMIVYLKKLIRLWCSKDYIGDAVDALPEHRDNPDYKFCFPSIKTTLQQRFDLYFVASLSDQEMTDMCREYSCIRQHLQYVDVLTQLQLGWTYSGSKRSRLFHSEHHPMESTSYHNKMNQQTRNLRLDKTFLEHASATHEFYNHIQYASINGVKNGLKLFPNLNDKMNSSRHLQEVGLSESFGSFVADYPEQFIDFACFKTNEGFCQQTLLLLTDEDPVHNPTVLRDPCRTPCFVPMTGILGGLVESFGIRQQNPYYKALGAILRSYGRFYCTLNIEGGYCGTTIFSKMATTYFRPYIPPQIPNSISLDDCGCSKSFINDGQCDLECFTKACYWDGDDCRIQNMFPEAFYALINIFVTRNTTEGYRLPIDIQTPCLFYDQSFQCVPKCRRFYEIGNNLEGCCFYGAIEALGSLLKVEETHPIVHYQERWMSHRSLYFLEQSCGITVDRTCMGGHRREILRFDLILENINSIHPSITQEMIQTKHVALTPYHNKNTYELSNLIRTTVSQSLQIVENDITRMLFRYQPTGMMVEIFIDSGRDSTRIKEFLYNQNNIKRLTDLITRRLSTLRFEVYNKHTKNIPRILISDQTIQSQLVMTPHSSFTERAKLPYSGTFGLGSHWGNSLPNQSCNPNNFSLLGKGYHIMHSNSVGSGNSVIRTIRCSNDYFPINSTKDVDVLICVNGRWMIQGGLQCYKRCKNEDIWKAITQYYGLRQEAYSISNQANNIEYMGLVPHGTEKILQCSDNHTPARGRSPIITTCIDGGWTNIILQCQRRCDRFIPPTPYGYIINGDLNKVDHGVTFTLRCESGYFPTPALTDSIEMKTRCQDGNWTQLKVSCIKPETIDPHAGPSMLTKLIKQLFTGPGMLGIIIALLLFIIIVIVITASWKLYFRQKANQNTILHEQNMDHVAKRSTIHPTQETTTSTTLQGHDVFPQSIPSSEMSNSSNWTAPDTNRSISSDLSQEKPSLTNELGEEEHYFGDVDLTPVSSVSEQEHIHNILSKKDSTFPSVSQADSHFKRHPENMSHMGCTTRNTSTLDTILPTTIPHPFISQRYHGACFQLDYKLHCQKTKTQMTIRPRIESFNLSSKNKMDMFYQKKLINKRIRDTRNRQQKRKHSTLHLYKKASLSVIKQKGKRISLAVFI